MGGPLYVGQGKSSGLSNNQCKIVDVLCNHPGDQRTTQGEHSETALDDQQAPSFDGLKLLHLNLSDDLVLGHNKLQMQKERNNAKKF